MMVMRHVYRSILGRTFLQEAYIIADYCREKITLYPAVYPEGDIPPNIVTICPPNSTTCISPISLPSRQPTKLFTGSVAGIAVGGVLALLILCLGVFYLRTRYKKPPPARPFLAAMFKPELPATEVSASKVGERIEDDPKEDPFETQPLHELESRFTRSGPGPWKLPDNAIIHELPEEGRY